MDKTLKFRKHLVPLVLSGEKTTTWRLFDDKDLQVGDKVELVNWNTGEVFAKAELINVREKKFSKITDEDFVGHKKYKSEEKMYESFRRYYGDKVNKDTIVKIINFELIPLKSV